MTKDSIIEQLKEQFKNVPSFTRKELFDFYCKFEPDLKETTFRWRIYYLKTKKIINSIDRATFSLLYKPVFTIQLEARQRDIFFKVEKQFPNVKICIWSTKCVNEFMLHQPNRFITLLEVENSTVETVFNFLKDNNIRNVYLQPEEKEIERYVFENADAVVVKTLITKAPTQKIKKVVVPVIEKLLVDIFSEKVLFNVFQGNELSYIFNTAYHKYNVNFTTLFHYAKRRGKDKELRTYITTKTDIQINDK